MATETTPLLSPPDPTVSPRPVIGHVPFIAPHHQIYLIVSALAVAFSVTQTPMLYSFRVFACEEFYKRPIGNVDDGYLGLLGEVDRCARREIESSAAAALSLMISLTTVAGVLNLLTTTYLIKQYGPKRAMIAQTFFPCLRNLCQTYAVYIGGRTGIQILQWTQLITILGGGAGYILTANTFIAALVLPEERTAAFGVLQGMTMLGTSIGFTMGGILSDQFGLITPWKFTFCLLVISTILSAACLPYINPTANESADQKESSASKNIFLSLFSPLQVFIPVSIISPEQGRNVGRWWGLTLLGAGAYIGVLATSYVPVMLQLSGTNRFGFGPSKNGYLMSLNSIMRAFFLTIIFPRIITQGRKVYRRFSEPDCALPSILVPLPPALPTSSLAPFEPIPDSFPAPSPLSEQESSQTTSVTVPPSERSHGSQFDLVFLRSSMAVDAVLTSLVHFANQGWHMYAAAGILPFASGTAPAAKGVIMEMVSKSDQADALAAIALLETLGMVSTTSLFGIIFAKLSEEGLGMWIFVLNGGTALVAAFVLSWVRFPPVSIRDSRA